MHCPFCAHDDTKVNDSRLAAEGAQIRRRRECLACGERFTTFETAELVMPLVVKNDQRRVPFDENKLRGGLHKALEKRPVSRESVEEAVGHITRKLRSLGEREVTSRQIGEIVMEELHKLDEVAYVRYASVYRHFQDVEAFREEVDRLRHRRGKMPSEDQLSLLPGRRCAEETGQGAQVNSAPSTKPRCAAHWSSRNAACTARIRIRASARCWRATRKSSARAGTNAPAKPHAEPIAIRAAGDRARGATAYVTLEPCSHHGRTPPCVDVLLAAGVRRVVYAVGDPNPRVNGAGAARLREAGVTVRIRVAGGRGRGAQRRLPHAHAPAAGRSCV